MRKFVAALVLVAAALVAPRAAHAGGWYDGYICSVMLEPSLAAYGSYGSLELTVYSGPSCSGSYVRRFIVCTTGATAASCVRRFSAAHLITLHDSAQRAASTNQRVSIGTAGSGASEGIALLQFRSN